MIYLVPHSGLANRIRAIASGISLSNEINQSLTVIWKKDEGCNVDFYELFQPIDEVEIIRENWRAKVMKFVRGKKYIRWLPSLIGIDFYMFDENFKQYVWSNTGYVFNPAIIKNKARNIYINTCNDFYNQKEIMAEFKPIYEIQILIDGNTQKFSAKTVGIHIRRTDNAESIEYSPVELYIHQMKVDVKLDSEVNFFLATDDLATEKMLKELFPGKIITAEKELTRRSKIGMVGAMVDLYCLANCSKIYGSYWSSFSDVSARIGDIPLKVIKKD